MTLDLYARNNWFSTEPSKQKNFDGDCSPYPWSYLLLSEHPEEILRHILKDQSQILFQPLSARCIWLSSLQQLDATSITNVTTPWELCRAAAQKPKKPCLVSFDMDSTLIKEEVIDELARDAGCYHEVSAVTAAAMRGELDFNQSLVKRVALLAGLEVDRLQIIADRLQFSLGAETLLNTLHNQGIKTLILSGGFDFFVERIAAKLEIKITHSNKLAIEAGVLTGKVIPPIVNAQRKADFLKTIAAENQIKISETYAVGDGANDLQVLNISGLGIAWHAKEKVSSKADIAINELGLEVISWFWE